ncbi:cytochrome C oxidase subunit IV family protein [Sorangium sp. So ce327]|jgi:cytochrome c oxidase subunit 4|uniref:cytochrome C oxidase subunit IV family protein n=1 Tax=unclassified Sorangium TaxID=2621164 RepID=UPI003F642DC7
MTVKHLSSRTYVIVWLLLMGLTLASYLLSLAHLGQADVVAALLIATVKTVLVLLFFMHLIEQRFANALPMIVAALLLGLLLTLMLSDVTSRETITRRPIPPSPLPGATAAPR